MIEEKFSVAMCVYGKDYPQWFQTAVESILNQTIAPDEVVLVVDGPVPEKLNEIINEYEERTCFRVLRLPENVGHGNARRICLEHCSNSLVALMDADDISVPDRFEKQLAVFRECPTVSIVGGNIQEFIGEISNVAGKRIVPEKDGEIKKYMKYRCPFNQMTVMFRKEDVQAAGGYLDWFCNEDYYLWLRMYLANMSFANVPEILVNVRAGEDLYKRRGGWKYFKSEYRLQKFMLKNRIINGKTFVMNVTKRVIVQVLLPNTVRGIVFKRFARS